MRAVKQMRHKPNARRWQLERICLSIIQEEGKLSWEVVRGWFLTLGHLEVIISEDSLLVILIAWAIYPLYCLNIIELGFCHLNLKVFWVTHHLIRQRKNHVCNIILKNWEVDCESTHNEMMANLNLSLPYSKIVPMAVATGGQEDLALESLMKGHKRVLYG